MKYPKFIQKNDAIGITALSNGIVNKIKLQRLDSAISKFKKRGYQVVETKDVRFDILGKSAPSKVQAMELEELISNDQVKVIINAAGGDFLMEMLPFINFDLIQKYPKWIQGYSDPTSLLFYITTTLDIATIYASNVCAFGMREWHKSLEDNMRVLEGKLAVQNSFLHYEKTPHEEVDGCEPFNLDGDVYWDIITKDKEIQAIGRIIGGCIDVLSDIFGTKYDGALSFAEKYKKDGLIWYFDVCELTSEALIKALWKMREAGWFQYAKCILFSRIIEEKTYYGISYEMAIKDILEELNIPIAINCDFGHVNPRISIINGSICQVKVKEGKGSMNFTLK